VTSVVNRYYDPSTDQFLSVDPMVDQTGQPYVFVNDNPLNSTDPLGLKGSPGTACASSNQKTCQKEEIAVLSALKKIKGGSLTVIISAAGTSIVLVASGAAVLAAIAAAPEEAAGAVSVAAYFGAVGTSVDAYQCAAHHNGLACAGFITGAASLSSGIVAPFLGSLNDGARSFSASNAVVGALTDVFGFFKELMHR
jgi:uncharacterized protein RhaS with RHS repeats